MEHDAFARYQLILRATTADGATACTGFAGMPGVAPAFIAVAAGESAAAVSAAAALARALHAEARAFGPGVSEEHVECGRWADGHAREAGATDGRAEVLVLVGDEAATLPDERLWAGWVTPGARGAVLIVLPLGPAGPGIAARIPAALGHLNVAWWAERIDEVVPDVLALAGVVPEERRVFVSYRRSDALEIAEQLFEELPKYRFDVFVDRFRLPPGRDFQERLTDELSHKSMILALESPALPESRWIEHELTFAQKHGLGRIALLLPGRDKQGEEWQGVSWIDEEYRVRVAPDELIPASDAVTAASRLTAAAVERLARRLADEHGRSLARRRAYLIDSVRAALTLRGVIDQRLDPSGHLHVRAHGGQRYIVWATPRPPEVEEFRSAHGACAPGPEPVGAMVTTALFREARRRDGVAWLAGRSLVHLTDAGRIADLADVIADGGTLR